MKKYCKDSVCRKCGNEGARSTYWNGTPDTDYGGVFGGIPEDFEPEETIIRKCWNCSYVWYEEVLN